MKLNSHRKVNIHSLNNTMIVKIWEIKLVLSNYIKGKLLKKFLYILIVSHLLSRSQFYAYVRMQPNYFNVHSQICLRILSIARKILLCLGQRYQNTELSSRIMKAHTE